jgi:hypothetical protein
MAQLTGEQWQNVAAAAVVAERIRTEFACSTVVLPDGEQTSVPVRVATVTCSDGGADPDELLDRLETHNGQSLSASGGSNP